MNGRIYGWFDGWTDGWPVGEGRMDQLTIGRVDAWTCLTVGWTSEMMKDRLTIFITGGHIVAIA